MSYLVGKYNPVLKLPNISTWNEYKIKETLFILYIYENQTKWRFHLYMLNTLNILQIGWYQI